MIQGLVGVVIQSLCGGSPMHHPIFKYEMQSTWVVSEFNMYA
jgi:hypothetical protein